MTDIMPGASAIAPEQANSLFRAAGPGLASGLGWQSGLAKPKAANVNAALPAQAPCSPGLYAAGGKRILDVFLIAISLPVALPVILVCALALWIEGGRPFYTQERLGEGGRRFRILKLRTMVRDADARLERLLASDPALRREWDETQKLKNDPRITPAGRLLRMTSMDELPQLWNVLRGDMSLVGPRPMLPEQLPLYGNPGAYFALKPGLTGTWQVYGRNDSSFASRAAADAGYHAGVSVKRDLALIWRTVGVVLRRTGY